MGFPTNKSRVPWASPKVTAHAVEALHRGNRVASHMRCAHKGGFTTVTEHLPERHQHQAQWTPERLVAWGERIGVACAGTVQKMLERQRHPEHAYRACLGLLSLSKRYGDARLEAACTLAMSLGTAKYAHIRDILLNRRDLLQPSAAQRPSGPAPPTPMCAVRTTTNEPQHGQHPNDDEHHLEPAARPAA